MTASERRQTVDRLFAEPCSCVIRNGGRLRVFCERGVKDLCRLLHEEPELLRGAFVADKVVGKGAAALMIAGGVAEVYAHVASLPALALLDRAGVRVEYGIAVPRIFNRTRTGLCPVEQLCADCTTAEECLPRIEAFVASQNG